MKPSSSFGQLIRQQRLALGLTQEELAERISDDHEYVRQTDISRLERDQVMLPRRRRLERIAEVLGIPLGRLLAASGWAGAENEFPESSLSAAQFDAPLAVPGPNDFIGLKDVQQLWEQFQTGRRPLQHMREVMMHEWQDERDTAADPVCVRCVTHSEVEALERVRVNADLVGAAGPFMEHLSMTLNEPHVVLLADHEGWILDMVGMPHEFGGRETGLVVGASLAEENVGSNGIGTALATGRPVLIHGVERYLGHRAPTACLGVPLRQNGSIIGALGILVQQQHADPARLDLAQACARSIDAVMTATARNRPNLRATGEDAGASEQQ